nr:PREDICTED: cardiomyopathy-associated protein 5 [Lepisosteus oculatus]
MEPCLPDECDKIEPEISFPTDDTSGEAGVLDSEEAEELRNSLKDLVQDHSVKPKLQCITVDPSFSMVTVQSEDSGIVWETASSRCSTPWASEASTTSDAYSLEGSATGSSSGKVVFIMDEDKIVRRRKRASLGNRVSDTNGRSRADNMKQFIRKPIATHPIVGVNREKLDQDEPVPHAPVISRPANNGNPHTRPMKVAKLYSEESSSHAPVTSKFLSKEEPHPTEPETKGEEPIPYVPVTSRPVIQRNPHSSHHKETEMNKDEPVLHTGITAKRLSTGNPHSSPLQEPEDTLLHRPVAAKPMTLGNPLPSQSQRTRNPHPYPSETLGLEQVQGMPVGDKQVLAGNPHPYPLQEQETETKEALPHAPVTSKPVEKGNMIKKEASSQGMGEGAPEEKLPSFSSTKSSLPKLESTTEISGIPESNPRSLSEPSVLEFSGNPKKDPSLHNPVPLLYSSSTARDQPQSENPQFLTGGNEKQVLTEVPGFLTSPGAETVSPNLRRDENPNVRSEQKLKSDEPTEQKEDPNSEKELFSIVSEGYEILNIIVPPKILMVDEEESIYMPDNLFYLEESPLIKSKVLLEVTEEEETPISETSISEKEIDQEKKVESEKKIVESERKETEQLRETEPLNIEKSTNISPAISESSQTSLAKSKNGNGDLDYFEKFTLVDDHVSNINPKEAINETKTNETSEEPENKEQASKSVSESEDPEFVFLDVEIASEHLDEVFYGMGAHVPEVCSMNKHIVEEEMPTKADKVLKLESPPKKSGTALFSTEEETLTRCYYYPATSKNIDPFLFEEPPAMSFLYTDLYEQAAGDKKKDDSEPSDEESVTSERILPRRLSDSDDNSGAYFEKYILIDDVPQGSDEPQPDEDQEDEAGKTWQSAFVLTGDITQRMEDNTQKTETRIESSRIRSELSPFEESEQFIAMSEEISEDLEFQPVFSDEETVPEEEVERYNKKSLKKAVEEDEIEPVEKQKEENAAVFYETGSTPAVECGEPLDSGMLNETLIAQDSEKIEEEIVIEKEVSMSERDRTESAGSKKEGIVRGEDLIETPEDIYTGPAEEERNDSSVFEIDDRVDQAVQDIHVSECEGSSEPELTHLDKAAMETEVSLTSDNSESKEVILEKVDETLQQLSHSIEDSDTWTKSTEKSHEEEVKKSEEIHSAQEWDSAYLSTTGSEIVMKTEEQETISSLKSAREGIQEKHEIVSEEQEDVEDKAFQNLGRGAPLRSMAPCEDLSQLGKECEPLEPELYQEPYGEHDGETAETLDYEMVTQQEVQEDFAAPETELIRDRECICEDTGKHHDQGSDFVDRDLPAQEVVEEGYEIIEALGGTPMSEVELSQMEPKKPLLDTFCVTCRCPISAIDKLFGDHQDHNVSPLNKAYDDIKFKLTEWIAELQGRTEKIEDLVSELELAFNTVEENCTKSEQSLEEQNDEMMKTILEQYNEMSQKMEDEKKFKLEQLYDQLVTFQESIDSAKDILEKTIKEVEEPDEVTFVTVSCVCVDSLNKALEKASSLELTPSTFPVFEDYAKTTTGNGHKLFKGIAVPQTPRVQPQEPNSATSTSVIVYWKVNEGDVIDCFQVYCMEEPQGAMSEEYRVTVKESYCTLEDLEPDKCYLVWVMAVNYTGCSLPSEKTSFRTAPSGPVIKTEECTVCWDSAIIRWSSTNLAAVESFTLEYCRQYTCEGEGLRSISGIRNCEHKVLLHPNENYLFYIKAVNSAGASEQSEAALISTKGTRFCLLKETANSALVLSEDKTTIYYHEQTFRQRATLNDCLDIWGELLPPHGYHYWETTVASSEAYRIGVAYSSTPHDSPLGQNSTSWGIHCYRTPSSYRVEFLHKSVQAEIHVVDKPTRIGTLLDYINGRLVFFNAQSGQVLYSCQHRFTEACHPALALEKPGSLALHTGMAAPDFVKHS